MVALAPDRVVTPPGRRWRADATAFLTLFLVLRFFVPSNMVLGPLGAAGTPASVLGMLGLFWWLTGRLGPRSGLAHGLQPVRIGLWIFAASILASYVAAANRSLSGVEVNGADRGILSLCGMIGVALVAVDGIPTLERLFDLLRRIVLGASALAVVGILQFTIRLDVSFLTRIPGLTPNGEFHGFYPLYPPRVAGTAQHPIEYGVMLALVLPLALAFALEVDRDRGRRRWIPPFLIALALPMSLSRSATVGVAAGLLVVFLGWNGRRRLRALIAAPFALLAIRVLVPGVLGTIFALFDSWGHDPSIQGRTDDYNAVWRFVGERPIFGRGFGTFDAKSFRVLDNQYLGTLVETGVVGLLAVVGLFLLAYFTARGARRRSADPAVREVAQALAAAVAVAALAFGTFDALFFSMVTGLLFLLIGCCGALWRLVRDSEAAGASPTGPGRVAPAGTG